MAHGDCGSPAAAWCTSQRSKARRGRSSSTANCGATRRSRRAWCPRLCPSSWIPRPRRWARRAVADSVLLIDDDSDVLRAVGDYFDRIGYEVARADAAEPGFEAFERMRPTVVILDLHLPDLDGLELLERLRAQGGSVILLTGHGDIATAVRAMQLGAEHFLTKPVDLNHLAAATARVGDKVRLARQNARLRAREHEHAGLESLGVSPAIRELGRQIELLAASERSTVLLTGESGTGKGWVARVIHHLSPRASGPFVEVNCGGLSATFLESELFGHEKGAFTDAKERRQGLSELADRGTIFLDEIGDLAPELQPKLQLRRQVPDFVEKDRSPIRQLEQALATLLRVGKGTLLVAEQLRLEECGREPAAVHLDEGTARAWGEMMDHAGHPALPGPALAGEQHGRALARRQQLDLAPQLANRGRDAE